MHFEKIKRYDVVHWNLLQLAKQNSLANRRVKQLRLLDKTLLPLVFCHYEKFVSPEVNDLSWPFPGFQNMNHAIGRGWRSGGRATVFPSRYLDSDT